jgi:hypothetical protein
MLYMFPPYKAIVRGLRVKEEIVYHTLFLNCNIYI